MCEGIAEELRGIDLGDKRLNKRSVRVIEALAANPEASINGACDGWGDTLGAYRLLDHPAVSPERILEPHRQATVRRMAEHPVVLIPQDTTELDLRRGATTDRSSRRLRHPSEGRSQHAGTKSGGRPGGVPQSTRGSQPLNTAGDAHG